jgi:hypothetical protein
MLYIQNSKERKKERNKLLSLFNGDTLMLANHGKVTYISIRIRLVQKLGI